MCGHAWCKFTVNFNLYFTDACINKLACSPSCGDGGEHDGLKFDEYVGECCLEEDGYPEWHGQTIGLEEDGNWGEYDCSIHAGMVNWIPDVFITRGMAKMSIPPQIKFI